MPDVIHKVLSLLSPRERRSAYLLLGMILIMAFLDVVGVDPLPAVRVAPLGRQRPELVRLLVLGVLLEDLLDRALGGAVAVERDLVEGAAQEGLDL